VQELENFESLQGSSWRKMMNFCCILVLFEKIERTLKEKYENPVCVPDFQGVSQIFIRILKVLTQKSLILSPF